VSWVFDLQHRLGTPRSTRCRSTTRWAWVTRGGLDDTFPGQISGSHPARRESGPADVSTSPVGGVRDSAAATPGRGHEVLPADGSQ